MVPSWPNVSRRSLAPVRALASSPLCGDDTARAGTRIGTCFARRTASLFFWNSSNMNIANSSCRKPGPGARKEMNGGNASVM